MSAGLADCYLVLPFLTSTTQEEAYPKAKEAAHKALALDPTLAEAHNSTAYTKIYLTGTSPALNADSAGRSS